MRHRSLGSRIAVLLGLSVLAVRVVGDEPLAAVVHEPQQARVNYMLNCQGCHLPEGRGIDGVVPAMQGSVGNFLRLPEGRAFLVQVPGSANAALDDASLADLLNWILMTMSADELPAGWKPFTAGEVADLRATPLREVARTRSALMARLNAAR